jgi:hypothetical protein
MLTQNIFQWLCRFVSFLISSQVNAIILRIFSLKANLWLCLRMRKTMEWEFNITKVESIFEFADDLTPYSSPLLFFFMMIILWVEKNCDKLCWWMRWRFLFFQEKVKEIVIVVILIEDIHFNLVGINEEGLLLFWMPTSWLIDLVDVDIKEDSQFTILELSTCWKGSNFNVKLSKYFQF